MVTNNNLFLFQKEHMESMETMKRHISVLAKTDKNEGELFLWKKMKLRFSSKFQRKWERETACIDLLKETLENLDEALSHIAQIKNKT